MKQSFLDKIRNVFSVYEIENNIALKWVFGATLLTYFVAFQRWFYSKALTISAYLNGEHRCWPYFQSCGQLNFLETIPQGFSQPILYMIFFAIMIAVVYFMYKQKWIFAWLLMLPIYIWHALTLFILTNLHIANYEYFLFVFATILLLLPHKEFFLKLSLVTFYFLASTIKIHEGWILGTYFSSLSSGMPIFPKWSIPIFTNLVIFMQIVGVWFLFSKNKILRNLTLVYLIIFHVYSGLLVGYRYPVTVLPTLLILFWLFYREQKIPIDKKSIPGWILIGFMFVAQSISFLIPGDVKMTMEGNNYGLYMFEANHQCVSKLKLVDANGKVVSEKVSESANARRRCDPYKYWFKIKHNYCKALKNQKGFKVEWTFDHSINGGPFYRIVDTKDACALDYKAFEKNKWIKDQGSAPIVGYPVENYYR